MFNIIITKTILLILLAFLFNSVYAIYFKSKKDLATREFAFILFNYRINNFYIVVFNVFSYLFHTVIIFFILRLFNLDSVFNLVSINPIEYFTLNNIIFIISFLFCIINYFKMLEALYFIDIIRLYLYLYHHSHFFRVILAYIKSSRFLIKQLIEKICRILQYCYDGHICSKEEQHLQDLLYFKINIYISIILREVFTLSIIIMILYSISIKNIYYTYYAIILYAFVNLCRKVLKLCYNTDMLYDKTLGDYYYNGASKNDSVVDMMQDLTNYLLNYIQNTHIREYGDINDYPYNVWPVRRFLVLLCSMLSLCYVFIYRNTLIESYYMPLNNGFIILVFSSLLTILWYIIGYNQPKEVVYESYAKYTTYGHLIYHMFFWCTSIAIFSFALIIFLHYNIPILMHDFLIESKLINIRLIYTTEEKIQYLIDFYTLVKDVATPRLNIILTEEMQQYLLKILKNIDFTTIIDHTTSLQDIRYCILSIIEQYYVVEKEIIKLIENLSYEIYLEEAYKIPYWFQPLFQALAWYTTGITLHQQIIYLRALYFVLYNPTVIQIITANISHVARKTARFPLSFLWQIAKHVLFKKK